MRLNHVELQEIARLVATDIKQDLAMTPGKWLTLKEAMEYARVNSPNTIKDWIKAHRIYGFKRSGSWIVDRDSIDRWYESDRFFGDGNEA